MTDKKKYHLALNPQAHHRIKSMAHENKCAPGDVVEALIHLGCHFPRLNFSDALRIATIRPRSSWVGGDLGHGPREHSFFASGDAR